MNLARYVTELLHELEVAAQSGGAEAQAVAERLAAAMESSARLILLEVISDATDEITRDLAPGSVEVRLRGRDPEFVVDLPPPLFGDQLVDATERSAPIADSSDADDSGTTRTTLRLPDTLKARVEDVAARDGVSVNAWLVRAISGALEPKRPAPRTARGGDRFTGWVR